MLREALFFFNLSMSIFISSMLTPEKRNVPFLQLLCTASMLGWTLYLKITLRDGSAMFSVKESYSLYLDIQILYYILQETI